MRVAHRLELVETLDARPGSSALVLSVREAEAIEGETVAAYLERVAWRFDLPTVLVINGAFYGRAEWATTPIAANDDVAFVSRPAGPSGSGGSTLKTVASIVALVTLTAVAGPAGPIVGAGGLALTGTAAALASAAIIGAGSLAISYFLRPKAGGKTAATDDLYAFALQGNAARPMQPIPVLYGRTRFAPDFAAPTYSEFDGDEMIDYALFALTCGRIRTEIVYLGDTVLWDSTNGPNPDYPGLEFQFVEPGAQVTLFPVNVVTTTEMGGRELAQEWSPGYIVNAAQTQADRLLLDFVWPNGCFRTANDKIAVAGTGIMVRIRTVNDAGAPIGAWENVASQIFTYAKQSQIRYTMHVEGLPPARYEVSVQRTDAPLTTNGQNAVTWSALRAHLVGDQSFPRVSTLAIKGTASKALSGVSGGQIRVVGTRILPVWQNGGWSEQPTRSITFAALDMWSNDAYAAGLSLGDIDFAAFLAYDGRWTDLGHTFDSRFTEVQNLDDALETILKAGRAIPAVVGDKLTVVREEPRGVARMLFTDFDIVRDSLEVEYALADEAWADGIIGEYVDETTWRLAEVSSAPPGVVLAKPARVQLEGMVQRAQALGAVRFMAAESQYRRVTARWTARMEGRLLKRGDLVRLTSEEPETWGQSCEVVDYDGDNLLTLDPPPAWDPTPGVTHWIEVRLRDGRILGPGRVYRGDTDAHVYVQDTGGLAAAVVRTDTQERASVAFSPGQPRSYPVLITDGDPDQDGEHIHLTGVLDDPIVYDVTEGGVPPLPDATGLFGAELPVIVGLGASISQRVLALILQAGWQPARTALGYVAEISYDGGASYGRIYEGGLSTFETPVGGSADMRLRVAGVTPAGVRGAWSVVALSAPDLVVDNDIFGALVISLQQLTEQVRHDIASIDAIGESAIASAKGTLRDELKKLSDKLDAFADAAATEAGLSYERREFIKVALTGRIQESFAAIEQETVARISANEALASVTTSLGARLTNAEGTITGQAGAISSLSTSVTSLGGTTTAQGQQITSLTARVDATEWNLSGQATATSALTTRVTATEGSITSQASQITSLQASVSTQNGQIAGQATATQQLSTRVSSTEGGISSLSSSLTALSTTQGSHTATLTQYGASIDGQSVQFGVTGYIDGQTGGFVFRGVRRLDGAVAYSVGIQGDLIVDGTVYGWKLAAQDLIVASAQIGSLVVDHVSIKDNAVTQSVSGGTDQTTVSVGITTRANSRLTITTVFNGAPGVQIAYNVGPGKHRVLRDGILIAEINNSYADSGGNNQNARYYLLPTPVVVMDAPGAGYHVYTSENTNGARAGGITIVVEELSK